MILETESTIQYKKAIEEMKALKPTELILPEFNDIYVFNEPDKKKYFKKKKIEVRDYYLSYVHDLSKKEKLPSFSYSQFREFCLLFNNTLGLYITQTGNWIKLPLGIGKFGISKFMPRYYKPRHVFRQEKVIENGIEKTIQKREIELNPNTHTQGYVCKFSWIKEDARIANKGSFRHMATSKLKRHMFESIMNLNADSKYHIVSREEELLTNSQSTKAKRIANRQKKIDEILAKK